jgi:hypothetical protein
VIFPPNVRTITTARAAATEHRESKILDACNGWRRALSGEQAIRQRHDANVDAARRENSRDGPRLSCC